jgi:hypothetical protein
VGVDRLDDDETPAAALDARASSEADVLGIPDGPEPRAEPRDRAACHADLRAEAEAEYRAYTIDRGCERVRETEQTIVTPAMHRIEAQDPDRHLVGLEHRLKGRDRIEEKVDFDIKKWGVTAEQAFANVKDAIRYTLQYPDDKYSDGVRADIERIKAEGFELVEFRNSWTHEEYKGINSRWRVPENAQLFEIQFHTQASFEAKQQTHAAYERLRVLPDDHEEVHELRAYQRQLCARIPVPPDAPEVSVP